MNLKIWGCQTTLLLSGTQKTRVAQALVKSIQHFAGVQLTVNWTLHYRELQEPLIPWEVVASLYSAIQEPNAQTKLDRMSESLSNMPVAHHGTLVILIQHLKKVMDCDQKTDINNMAITFGPNLMWAPLKLQSANTTVTIQKQQMVIKGLLENANYLFDISDESRHSSRASL